MATAPHPAPVKQMEALLECSMCIETITEPRTLSCFHSFCKHCLAKFVATQKEAVEKGAKYAEPSFASKKEKASRRCHQTISSTACWTELLALTQQDQSIKCQSCKARNPAVSRCVSCEAYLCETHNNWPAFQDHVVLTLEELAKPVNRAKARGKPRCDKHKKVLMTSFTVKRAKSSFADVVGQHKEALKASCAIFEQQANDAAQSSLKIEDAMATLRNNATKTKDAIMQQQQEILSAFTKKLEQETAVLPDQVDIKYKQANEPLVQQQADVKDCLKKAKSSLEFANNIISSGSDEDILSFKQVIFMKRLDVLKMNDRNSWNQFTMQRELQRAKQEESLKDKQEGQLMMAKLKVDSLKTKRGEDLIKAR
ncbi:partial [Paramuricea clavata]|uniref:Partial n=1 Tax=Paramuricea clavata TaxID=317549 RepID=A0A7D9I332_PARCT|nr:partial [Paramuricea clavata]